MKVFLYERVSSEEQAKHGYSLDAQHEALVEFCDRHNHVILGNIYPSCRHKLVH